MATVDMYSKKQNIRLPLQLKTMETGRLPPAPLPERISYEKIRKGEVSKYCNSLVSISLDIEICCRARYCFQSCLSVSLSACQSVLSTGLSTSRPFLCHGTFDHQLIPGLGTVSLQLIYLKLQEPCWGEPCIALVLFHCYRYIARSIPVHRHAKLIHRASQLKASSSQVKVQFSLKKALRQSIHYFSSAEGQYDSLQ